MNKQLEELEAITAGMAEAFARYRGAVDPLDKDKRLADDLTKFILGIVGVSDRAKIPSFSTPDITSLGFD